ncbi:MAG: hypothetical protein ACR2QU_00860 [Gammaproteobacteria bacterium]
MLKIIGFIAGTVLTVMVMLFFAGSVAGTGAQGEFKDVLASVAERLPGADTATSEIQQPFSAEAVLEKIAVAGEETSAQEPVVTPAEMPKTNEDVSAHESTPHRSDDSSDRSASEDSRVVENQPVAPVDESIELVETGDIGSWHAFWTPFRSEASANGFAARLGRDTNREYRVIRTGPGEYRVAFFHVDDIDRRARLVEIEQVSGLKLGGGEL